MSGLAELERKQRELEHAYRAQTPGMSEYATAAREELFPTPSHMVANTPLGLVPGLGDAAEYNIAREEGYSPMASMAWAAAPAFLGQVVHHGTRHFWPSEPKFPKGRPRLDKVGSGEGGALAGWGTYLAEEPRVSDTYRTAGQGSRQVIFAGDQPVTRTVPRVAAAETLMRNSDPAYLDHVVRDLRRQAEHASLPLRVHYNRTADAIDELRGLMGNGRITMGEYVPEGPRYKMDLPDEVIPGLLDLDKPVREQGGQIIEALERAAGPAAPMLADRYSAKALNALKRAGQLYPGKYKDVIAELELAIHRARYQNNPMHMQRAIENAAEKLDQAGIYDTGIDNLAWNMRNMIDNNEAAWGVIDLPGWDAQEQVIRSVSAGGPRNKKAASEALRREGLLGNTFLDKGSRMIGQGSHNYVIWDQDLLDAMPILDIEMPKRTLIK